MEKLRRTLRRVLGSRAWLSEAHAQGDLVMPKSSRALPKSFSKPFAGSRQIVRHLWDRARFSSGLVNSSFRDSAV